MKHDCEQPQKVKFPAQNSVRETVRPDVLGLYVAQS